MDLDYILTYVGLVALLSLTIAMINIPEPRSNLNEFLIVFAKVVSHPGSMVRVRLILPKGVSVEASGRTIRIAGEAVAPSVVEVYRSLGILEDYSGNNITLKINITTFRLSEGYIYTIQLYSTPKTVHVKVLDMRKIP